MVSLKEIDVSVLWYRQNCHWFISNLTLKTAWKYTCCLVLRKFTCAILIISLFAHRIALKFRLWLYGESWKCFAVNSGFLRKCSRIISEYTEENMPTSSVLLDFLFLLPASSNSSVSTLRCVNYSKYEFISLYFILFVIYLTFFFLSLVSHQEAAAHIMSTSSCQLLFQSYLIPLEKFQNSQAWKFSSDSS